MTSPPRPAKRPTVLRAHGDERTDEWYWLNQRDDPEVIAHLEAENDYTAAVLAPTETLRKTLYDEIVSRIQETDLSVPVRHKGWWHYSRNVEGEQYTIHCRCPADPGRPHPPAIEPGPALAPDAPPGEEVLLDENAAAAGYEYFHLGGFEISPDQRLLAWASDTTGGEKFTLRVRDLSTGADLPDEIEGVYYGLAWASDNRTIFYTRPNEAMRPYQVWRHAMGSPAADDVLVFQEDDDRFFVGVDRTKDGALILIGASSSLTTEYHFLDAAHPDGELRVVAPRETGVEYHPDHQGDRFVIVTNADGAENFALLQAPVADPGRSSWAPVVPYDPAVRLYGVDVFQDYLVLEERAEGLQRLRVMRVADGRVEALEHPEPVHTVTTGSNPDYDATVYRFLYTSLVTPASVYDHDFATGERVLLKQQPVLGGYDPTRYRTDRLWATAADGTRIPISVVHRDGLPLDGSAPCVLYGYGSYEISIDPYFSPARLSLLERGFVFAIAHVRGGGEMGRRWYEDGKFQHKANSFSDFVSAATYLIDTEWTSAERLVIRGGSAGGLLMGASVNLAPELFAAVVAEVPFVDCLTTMLDASLPLTANEWEEWGNPIEDADVYHYMKSYSPYDNVGANAYPPILVTAGLNDPRVGYWEPAKWVARLRDRKTDSNQIVLKTEMGAGHGGPSGRYDSWRDEALVLAFIVDAVGLSE